MPPSSRKATDSLTHPFIWWRVTARHTIITDVYKTRLYFFCRSFEFDQKQPHWILKFGSEYQPIKPLINEL